MACHQLCNLTVHYMNPRVLVVIVPLYKFHRQDAPGMLVTEVSPNGKELSFNMTHCMNHHVLVLKLLSNCVSSRCYQAINVL